MEPFSNGTEFGFWYERNCQRCANFVHWEDPLYSDKHCDIEEAIALASVTDGEIDEAIAARAGVDNDKLTDRCKEYRQMPEADHV